MFELAQLNLFTPEKKKGGGHPLAIHRQLLVGAGTRGDGVCGKDLNVDADPVGAHGHGGVRPGGGQPGYAGLMHGIASRPKSKPKVAATPATGGPPQPHPPNLRPSQPRAHPCHPPRVPPEGERCCAVRDRHPPLSCNRATQPHPRSPFPGFAPLPHRHIPRAYS